MCRVNARGLATTHCGTWWRCKGCRPWTTLDCRLHALVTLCTTGRRSARSRRIEVITRGERRRVLDVEQKRDIVLASLQPGARPADVACALRHYYNSFAGAVDVAAISVAERRERPEALGNAGRPRISAASYERRRRVSGMEHLTRRGYRPCPALSSRRRLLRRIDRQPPRACVRTAHFGSIRPALTPCLPRCARSPKTTARMVR